MKKKRIVASVFAFVSMIALANSSSAASTVYLLQLGSYPSENEASNHWKFLQKEFSGELSSLPVSVSAVKSPVSNDMAYRVKAGPVSSIEEGNRICDKLNAKMLDCFVMETAMEGNTPSDSNTQQASANSTSVRPEAAQAAPENFSDLPAESADLTADMPPSLPSETLQGHSATSEAEQQTAVSAPATETAEAMPVAAAAEAPKPKKRSFFSFFGFGKDEEEERAEATASAGNETMASNETMETMTSATATASGRESIAAARETNTVVSAPVQQTNSEPAGTDTGDVNQYPEAAVTAPSGEVATPAASIQEMPTANAQMVSSANASPAQTTVLPAAAQAMATNQPRAAMPAPVSGVAPSNSPTVRPFGSRAQPMVAMPVNTSITPGGQAPMQPISAGAPVIAPVPVVPVAGQELAREEAVRVPVTSWGNSNQRIPEAGSVTTSPSQVVRGRTLWANISRFTNEAAARNFWYAASSEISGLPSVRMRVVQPYQARYGVANLSLRVGPFANNQQIANVCAYARSKGLVCTTVRDLGNSSAAWQQRDRYNVNSARYPVVGSNAMGGGIRQGWVQLGTFNNPVQAERQWQALKSLHRDLLGNASFTISRPPASSASAPIYRLRVGPFINHAVANESCMRLRARQVGCIAVVE